ncbi:hypothetical protein KY306_00920 [Candidatus Woesearchaeota archaeon]|nr:hypothetical protein [Candidatus Woesearchaeota archaeon]
MAENPIYQCPNKALTKADLINYANLRSQLLSDQELDPFYLKTLDSFGKDAREICKTIDTHLAKCPDCQDELNQDLEKLTNLRMSAEITAEGILNLHSGSLEEYTMLSIGEHYQKAKSDFEPKHLDVSSDPDWIARLKDYLFKKMSKYVHDKPFKLDPEFEKHLDGCQTCQDYQNITEKFIRSIIKCL